MTASHPACPWLPSSTPESVALCKQGDPRQLLARRAAQQRDACLSVRLRQRIKARQPCQQPHQPHRLLQSPTTHLTHLQIYLALRLPARLFITNNPVHPQVLPRLFSFSHPKQPTLNFGDYRLRFDHPCRPTQNKPPTALQSEQQSSHPGLKLWSDHVLLLGCRGQHRRPLATTVRRACLAPLSPPGLTSHMWKSYVSSDTSC